MIIRTTSYPERKIAVIRLEGKMTLGGGSRWAAGLYGYGQSVILDLSGVESLDSTGLGELMGVYTNFSHRNLSLVLLNPRTKILDILSVTEYIRWFIVFDNEQKAVESFPVVA